jgi:hypothetical protein
MIKTFQKTSRTLATINAVKVSLIMFGTNCDKRGCWLLNNHTGGKRMKLMLSVIYWLILVFLPVSLQAATTQQQIEEDYFKDSLKNMTEILPIGKTVITARSDTHKVIIVIHASKKQLTTSDKKKGFTEKSLRMSEYYVDISVNDDDIIVPDSVFSDLHDLNRGRVVLTAKKIILILEGGDAAEIYNILIEFDNAQINRKRKYFQCCDPRFLFEETVYHRVVL